MKNQTRVHIVKIGGGLLESPELLASFLPAFAALPGAKILIHGGGQRASQMSKKLGIEPKMQEGRRITDAQTLEVALMVYGGWANKTVVAHLQALNCPALGVSGADGDLIRAVKRPVDTIDFGFVGDVSQVNTKALTALIESGFVPVFCALSHDGQGQMLNTNADTIAAEVAIALSEVFETHLYYCFEKDGVLQDINDSESVIPHLNLELYAQLKQKGIIAAGMLPKLHNCFQALKRGVAKVFVGSPNLLITPNSKHTQVAL
ncbi:MAG: hypothetical protein RLZZ241_1427 [Bacteroidota bacterium]|jgi:acetylglutamate kinase